MQGDQLGEMMTTETRIGAVGMEKTHKLERQDFMIIHKSLSAVEYGVE